MPIRIATANDLPQLLDLIQPLRSPAFNWDAASFRSEFKNAVTWVWVEDEVVLAFACMRDAVEAWEISILATRQDRRHRGHMRNLLQALIERFGEERHFWLEVHEKNEPAQKLYEKLGFHNDGRRGGYYSDGSAALLYSLEKKPRFS